MQGHAIPLEKFIEGNKNLLIIPVYQRNYDWKIDNCNQLFNDIVKLQSSGRANHFFGSIVSSTADSIGFNRLIIDGQQRLTTISLLLLAAIHAARLGKLAISDMCRINEATDIYLTARFCSSERKIKLVPIEKDREAFDKIFKVDVTSDFMETLTEGSKVTRNYRHFLDLLTDEKSTISFDGLLDSIGKLQIISIELEANDEPQLIFESLNSTGLALSEADKIRNYLLMSLSSEDQMHCFKDYWQPIESKTSGDPTMFLRDYITIIEQLQRPAKIDNLYFVWKKYMSGRDRQQELMSMLEYAELYRKVAKADLGSQKLNKKMNQLNNLETDIINVFWIQFFKYAFDNNLSEDEIWQTLDVVENYMARRIICALPSNALTQIFCSLHKDVTRSIDEYQAAGKVLDSSYADILTYHIMRREGNHQLPRDAAFKESITRRDAYHMLKPFQRFLFERLENSNNKEYIDVPKEMKDSEATIEHIMPQTLSNDWKQMLGDDYEKIQEFYLHTFCNLTLTGVNTELSNHPFIEKKEGKEINGEKCNGYNASKYRLTRDIVNYSQWTKTEMDLRNQTIVDKFMALYPLPSTDFKPLPKAVDEVSLEDESMSPKSRTLMGYSLLGQSFEEKIWANFYINVVKILLSRYPDEMELLINNHYLWDEQHHNDKYCTKIQDNLYLWTSMANETKICGLRYIFDTIDLDQSELTICMEPKKN